MKSGYAALLLLMFGAAGRASAHSGDDPLSNWYRSLVSDGGVSCCSEEDCHPVDAKYLGGEWLVFGESGWEIVPAESILHRENLDGRPILCRVWKKIQCFVPPPES
jgi:hypothetical protein